MYSAYSICVHCSVDRYCVHGIIIFLVAMLNLNLPILGPVLLAIQLYKYCSHAVVYGLHDKYVDKEFKGINEKFRGLKKSKVIMLTEWTIICSPVEWTHLCNVLRLCYVRNQLHLYMLSMCLSVIVICYLLLFINSFLLLQRNQLIKGFW